MPFEILELSERDMTIEAIVNVYKSANGFKPRHINFDAMSQAELDQMLDDVALDNDREMEREAAYSLQCQKTWEIAMLQLAKAHGISRAAAIRWDFQAENIDLNAVDFYCYCKGLHSALEEQIRKDLR